MPASRWNSNLLDEILAWIDEDELTITDLILNPIVTRVVDVEEDQSAPKEDTKSIDDAVPAELPILPLRGLVVYPETAVPLTIGQPRSIRLVDDVIAQDSRLIGLVASRDPELEAPTPEDLYTVGTVATVHRMFRAPDGTIRLLVQGMHRFKLGEFTEVDPYLKAEVLLIPETAEDNIEIDALARNARELFKRIADMVPSIPRELVESITALESPLQTVYTIANFQRIELEDAQALLEIELGE